MNKKPTFPRLQEAEPSRLCWSCTEIRFFPADPAYSADTPGSAFELECAKGYWTFDAYRDDLSTFRQYLQAAEWCADFRRRRDD